MNRKGENTRRDIREKARALFCEKGYKDVTMQDLCLAAGLSRGGLYRHYESTEQIFLEILACFSQDQNREIQEKIDQGISASLILDGLLNQYQEEMLDSKNSLSLAICEFFSTAAGQETGAAAKGYQASKKGWTALVEYGIETGEFRWVNPASLFDLLVFAYQGVRLYSRLMEIDRETPGRILGEIRKMLLAEAPAALRLVRPDLTWKEKALAFRQEFFDHGESIIFGSELLDKTEDYAAWLKAVTRNTNPDTVSPDWVQTDTFFAVDNQNEIVGIIDLRHRLTGFLQDLGNCGYSVRPSQRQKGFGKQMLGLLLEHARSLGMERLQVSVETDNLPSVRAIQSLGGLRERGFCSQGKPADVYQIPL